MQPLYVPFFSFSHLDTHKTVMELKQKKYMEITTNFKNSQVLRATFSIAQNKERTEEALGTINNAQS